MTPCDLPNITPHQIDLFWTKVERREPGECWMWRAGLSQRGYGKIAFGGSQKQRHYRAHRVALYLATGIDGDVAIHSCDTPACVNPAHLRWGTIAENNADCMAKRRHAHGDRQWLAKLTSAQVDEIRRRYTPGSSSALAKEFGVNRSYIWSIATHRTRRHA